MRFQLSFFLYLSLFTTSQSEDPQFKLKFLRHLHGDSTQLFQHEASTPQHDVLGRNSARGERRALNASALQPVSARKISANLQRLSQDFDVAGFVVVQNVLLALVAVHVEFVHVDHERMPRFFEVIERVFVNVPEQ